MEQRQIGNTADKKEARTKNTDFQRAIFGGSLELPFAGNIPARGWDFRAKLFKKKENNRKKLPRKEEKIE